MASRLVQHRKTRVRGLVLPALSNTKQFDGLPVEKVSGDITSIEDMRRATHGCDIVIHCAIGKPNVTVNGTRNVTKAATENGIKRFVHMSSTAVYGYYPSANEAKDGRLQNTLSRSNYYNEYCHSKIASESIAFSYHDAQNLPLVVLRPSNIYGPNSTWWTIMPIDMLREGCCVLVNGGLSPSNTVYIDDVVDAIELAIREDNAVGHAFTISSNQNTSWRDFFSSYAKMFARTPALLDMTLEEIGIEKDRRRVDLMKRMFSSPKNMLSLFPQLAVQTPLLKSFLSLTARLQMMRKLRTMIPKAAKIEASSAIEETRHSVPTLSKIPDLWLEKSFTMPFSFPINGAAKVLGFKPHVSLDEGMGKTQDWLIACRDKTFTPILETFVLPELTIPDAEKRLQTYVAGL